MSREDIEKLLGGYATGTLTAEEQRALFDAALDDQALFDALAREQSLRDLLRDPAARAHLLGALDNARVPSRQRQIDLPLRLVSDSFGRAATPGVANRLAGARAWISRQMTRPAALGVAASLLAVAGGLAMWFARRPAGSPKPAQQLAIVARAPEVRSPETAFVKPPEPNPRPPQRKEPRRIVRAEKISPPPVPAPATRATAAIAEAKQRVEELRAATGSTGAQDAVSVQAEAQPIEPARAALPQAQPFLRLDAPPLMVQPVSAVQEPPVRVRVLRKREDGTTAEANPADLHAGDTVVLEFHSNLDGFLTVTEFPGAARTVQPLIANQRIEPAKAISTPPLGSEQPAVRKFVASFTPQPGAAGVVSGNGQVLQRAAQPREQRPVMITLTYK